MSDQFPKIEQDMVLVPREALNWLFGSEPDADGKWFGECEDEEMRSTKRVRKYWWRTKFRSMIPALSGDEGK